MIFALAGKNCPHVHVWTRDGEKNVNVDLIYRTEGRSVTITFNRKQFSEKDMSLQILKKIGMTLREIERQRMIG